MEISFQYTLRELSETADEIIKLSYKSRLILFFGEMGTGKTTLIRALCYRLKIKDEVTSPTFSIINEYRTSDKGIIYHFDLYRLAGREEAENIGISEYLDSGNLCLIEWPEKLPYYFDYRPSTKVKIFYTEDQKRKILISN